MRYADNLTIEQRFALLRMNEIRREKLEGYAIHLVEKMPPLYSIPYPLILGSYAWTSPQAKEKFMLLRYAVDHGGGYVSPADIARDYLSYRFPPDKKRRMRTSQYDALVRHRTSPPLYSSPATIPDAIYVDLVGAYYTITRVVGWDVDYNPGKWLAVKSDIDDWPFPNDKLARNILVTAGLPGRMNTWDGERLGSRYAWKTHLNHMLWGVCMDVLNGLAADMVELGAVHVHTDGYLLPASKHDDAMRLMDDWGLIGSLRYSGYAIVHSPGGYRIGDRVTKKFHLRPKYHDKVSDRNRHWLRDKMKFWSVRRGITV